MPQDGTAPLSYDGRHEATAVTGEGNLAIFCDFENIALGVRDAKLTRFDILPKGESVIDGYFQSTNAGRRMLGALAYDREGFERMMGQSSPTPRQLLGKDRVAVD
jgi:hypothetical protein